MGRRRCFGGVSVSFAVVYDALRKLGSRSLEASIHRERCARRQIRVARSCRLLEPSSWPCRESSSVASSAL